MQFDDSDIILGDRLLAKGQSLTIAGQGGTGKSRLLLQLAVCSILNLPFIGLETRGEKLRWLILQVENSNRRLQDDFTKLRQWVGDERWDKVDQLLHIHTLESDIDGFLSLDDPDPYNRISDVIAELQPDVVGCDSLYNFGIGDLNKDQDMRDTLMAISRLTKKGNPARCNVVLHHALTGKAGASKAIGYDRTSFARNSKVLQFWTRGAINIAPGAPDNNEVLVVTCGKCSDGRPFAPFAIRLKRQTMIYEVDESFDLQAWQGEISDGRRVSVSDDQVWMACEGESKKKELVKTIMDETSCGKTCAYEAIDRAVLHGRIHYSKETRTYTQVV